jgi:hypothetical protein
MTDAADRLRKIKRFDQLVAYLRDVLDWPMEDYPFEDLTFDWDPEELGIDLKTAAKIQEIKQLRPLASGQEWGIFFVKFEPKRLPVVALRRLLNRLVIKKRASAQSSDMASWRMHDLLFVSQYGEGDQRKITFANFTAGTGGAIPTLKVLDWDEDDTGMKLQHVDQQLRRHLCWPKDESDIDAWRTQWSAAFTLRHRHVIRTAKELAASLAELCGEIWKEMTKTLDVETDEGPVRKWFKAFEETLLHGLTEADFADMYAQTIAYGLFTVAIANSSKDLAPDLSAEHLVEMVPTTKPFLREMLETFLTVAGRKGSLDFDELGIEEVAALLRDERTDLQAVLRDFGNRGQGEDPIVHFYEDFLKCYDHERKKARGVYYTPRPVVCFIVRGVHEALQTEFGLEDGLASTVTWGEMTERHNDLQVPDGIDPSVPFVQILDPATGTGTFLLEVIDVIHRTMKHKWKAEGLSDQQRDAAWTEYVPRHLLPRLHGYELMMAPYAIAHVNIGLKLAETGYRAAGTERAKLYLTNALESPTNTSQLALADWLPVLAQEAEAVNALKRNHRFTVVIGNPPYSGVSSNMSGDAPALVAPYKFVDGKPLNERKHWLQDDYVKFIRLAQNTICLATTGIWGMITNHGFLDNATFRGMRWNLLSTFERLEVVDLHGNANKKETSPDGSPDKNVFDIRQGVCICIGQRVFSHVSDEPVVLHTDMWGERSAKYDALLKNRLSDIPKCEVQCQPPFYFFVPREEQLRQEFELFFSLTEVFPENVTVPVTARDHFVVDIESGSLLERVKEFRDMNLPDDYIRQKYFAGRTRSKKYPDGDTRGWKMHDARRRLASDDRWARRVRTCLYRPFDERCVYWANWMIDWPRGEIVSDLERPNNLALVTRRQMLPGQITYFFVTNKIPLDGVIRSDNKGQESVFPLFTYHDDLLSDEPGEETANIAENAVVAIAGATELTWSRKRTNSDNTTFDANDVFAYAYSIFHSPAYRDRYADLMVSDFPRLPVPATQSLFRLLVELGSELVSLHLLESSKFSESDGSYSELVGVELEVASFSDETVWIDKAKSRGFKNVSERVWGFFVGGHQPCQKWLKDRQAKGGKNPRPGRKLTKEDIEHYQKIVVAICETIRLMGKVDEVIEQHGGWPDAFVTEPVPADE